MRRLAAAFVLTVIALTSSTAVAHKPGTDGGEADRGCGVVRGASKYGPVGVGATRVSCKIARIVARGSVKGERFTRWRCTGRRTRFGHCHGRGIRKGGVVHWYAAH